MLPLSNSRRKTLFRAGLFCDLKVLLKKLIFFLFQINSINDFRKIQMSQKN